MCNPQLFMQFTGAIEAGVQTIVVSYAIYLLLQEIHQAYAASADPLGLQSACPGGPSQQLQFTKLQGHKRKRNSIFARPSKEGPLRGEGRL